MENKKEKKQEDPLNIMQDVMGLMFWATILNSGANGTRPVFPLHTTVNFIYGKTLIGAASSGMKIFGDGSPLRGNLSEAKCCTHESNTLPEPHSAHSTIRS